MTHDSMWRGNMKEQVRRKKVHGDKKTLQERNRIIQIIENFPLAQDMGLCEVSPCRECNSCVNLKRGLIEMISDPTAHLTNKPLPNTPVAGGEK